MVLTYSPVQEIPWDWLGEGIYFWEANPLRGLEFAELLQSRRAGQPDELKEPFVIGAAIDLGRCLDLCSSNGVKAIVQAHESLMKYYSRVGEVPPVNRLGDDLVLRDLDCAVVMHLHEVYEKQGLPPYETVKALFREGDPVYDKSGFYEKTHVQICVRDRAMIKGVFRVKAADLRVVAPPTS